MTIQEAISAADSLRPNAFDTAAKVRWLNDCEGLIQTEIMLIALDDVVSYDGSDLTQALLLKPPHEKIYRAYLLAMIDFANGEYNRYNNDLALYNSWLNEYARWFARTYRPADDRAKPWPGYYLDAYSFAAAHGYTGTREDFERQLADFAPLAEAAAQSATAAAGSATAAETARAQSVTYAQDAEAWAKGTRNGVGVTSGQDGYNSNAKYYQQLSARESNLAWDAAAEAQAWANGTEKDFLGFDGQSPVDSEHFAYHNNAQYYAGQAGDSATAAAASATAAGDSATAAAASAAAAQTSASSAMGHMAEAEQARQAAEAYAAGTENGTAVFSTHAAYQNNAKYYAQQAAAAAGQSAIDARVANTLAQNVTYTATALSAGSAPSVSATQDAQTGAVTLSFAIPQGYDGASGDSGVQGPQGVAGPQGPQGVSVTALERVGGVVYLDGASGSVYAFRLSDGTQTASFEPPRGATGPQGDGVPTGGTAGQVLTKTESGTSWAEVDLSTNVTGILLPAYGGTGNNNGRVTVGRKENSTVGTNATADGESGVATGAVSHAEGLNTTSSGNYSHSEGQDTIARAVGSHAEGNYTTVDNSAWYAHTEGIGTTAKANGSHAEGSLTTTRGLSSHAEGRGTVAAGAYQHVSGRYNVADTYGNNGSNYGNYIEIVGNGTSDAARSNARTLDWSGNAWYSGKVTMGSPGTGTSDAVSHGQLNTALGGKLDVPTGGTAGQVLTKTAYGAAWQDVPESSVVGVPDPTERWSSSEGAAVLVVGRNYEPFWSTAIHSVLPALRSQVALLEERVTALEPANLTITVGETQFSVPKGYTWAQYAAVPNQFSVTGSKISYLGLFYVTWQDSTHIVNDVIINGRVYGTISDTATIQFTIGSDTFSADYDMTWREWVASEYNTAGYVISGNYVQSGNGIAVVGITVVGDSGDSTDRPVSPDAVIVADAHYLRMV